MLAKKQGAGIGRIAHIGQTDRAEAIEALCFDTIGAWLSDHPELLILMTGAVGSNLGWRPAPYAATPATVDDLVAGLTRFEARGARCAIIPGVETVRPDGAPDVMRGEEVQIFGTLDSGDDLFCLPGTHSKWAVVRGGKITGFHSAQTGELLDLVGRHSILLNPRRPVSAQVGDAFRAGVELARTSAMGLESLMFTVRSRQISGDLTAGDADSYFAGIAIGCELKSALSLYAHAKNVTLVGLPALTALYETALSAFGMAAKIVDGNKASTAGLHKIYNRIAR